MVNGESVKVLFAGDVSGKPGRKALHTFLEKERNGYDFIIVNGENAAAGFGITEKIAKSFFSWGVDIITMGNHVWDRKEIFEFIDKYPIVRPLNLDFTHVGKSFAEVDIKGLKIIVVNLLGRVFMECCKNPFLSFDSIYEEKSDGFFIVDFHGEATSEKQAFGFYVDGRAGAVFGTHTHVQTADLRLLREGTLYITDVGMCGALDSVIGMDYKESVERFVKQVPVKFKIPEKSERIRFSGVSFSIDVSTKKIIDFERINRIYTRSGDGNYY